MDKIRLQVAISRSGYCSRREAMKLVQSGKVTLNGKVESEPSTPVDIGVDRIAVDGKPVSLGAYTYLMINKPRNCVTTRKDRHADKTIYDIIPKKWHGLKPVGRLDKDTEGLLLLTNDGDLAFRVTHPKFTCDKVYVVRVFGELNEDHIAKLEGGVVIDKRKTAPAQIRFIKKSKGQTQFEMTIHEGRKRQIRRMLDSVGHRVVYLQRIALGPLKLGDLKPGQIRDCRPEDIKKLKDL